MPHRPQTLIPSSSSTTSNGRIGARGRTAWCFTARVPLFLRRQAPRSLTESGFEAGRRGASPPASPCFFVAGHHAPDFLQPDNSGNPPRVPGIPISPKTKNFGQGAAPAAPCRNFPFPYQSVETVPLYTLRGQSLSYPILSYPILILCSALLNFPKNKNGAEDEIRTRDPRLGKAMLYP